MKRTGLIFITGLCVFYWNACANVVKPEQFPIPTAAAEPGRIAQDSLLLLQNDRVLKTLQAKDYKAFATFIHPDSGIRFSPYGHIDPAGDICLSPSAFRRMLGEGTVREWGYYDGSGEPIALSLPEYINRFVYDADFLEAPQKAVNKILGTGNTLHNIQDVYPGLDFTENYFPGRDPAYGGLDWRSLRLVFRIKGDRLFLVGIVHDEWTI